MSLQPANDDFAEKTCCTVTIGGVNVAEALVAKGLATVVRWDDKQIFYDFSRTFFTAEC